MPTNLDIDAALAQLKRRADRILTEDDLRAKLANSAKSGKPLRIKLGMDPTAPDVHLGHSVPLRVIRTFQELGHKAVLIIGDATARVGDPSGADVTRPMLTKEQIDHNATTYVEQVGKILLSDPEHLEIRRNSEWLDKMDLTELIRLAARKSVAQMLERDSFAERYKAGIDIRLHEFIYPLLQGWDSVVIDADVELGGNDQLFNNLVGREFQQQEKTSPPNGQVVIVAPLLVGTDGKKKMSKSKGNYIGLTDPAGGDGGMFGKVMSLPDEVMAEYFRLVTDVPESEYRSLIQQSPRDAKVRLAKEIIRQFHPAEAADAAEQQFMTATHGGIPSDIPERQVGTGPHALVPLLVEIGFCASNSEAVRKIREGGVRLDGEKIEDTKAELTVDGPKVLQLGKRKFVRLS